MSRDKQRLLDYLGHILEAIERIDRYTEDKVDFEIVWKTIQNDLSGLYRQVRGGASSAF